MVIASSAEMTLAIKNEDEAAKMSDPLNEIELVCPILKKACLGKFCAWYQVSGQCSITVLAQAFCLRSKGAGLGPL